MTAVAWPAQLPLATALAEMADAPAVWPGLGRRDNGPLRLIIVPDRQRMRDLTGGRAPSWGAGIAMPGSRTIMMHEGRIVLDLKGDERRRLSVEDLLRMFSKVRGETLDDDALLLN